MTIPPDHLDLVLAHIRGRQRSQSSPATGLYWMSDDHYRACIDALRDQGHNLAEVIVAGGDRASNETGYILIESPTDLAHLDTLRSRAAHLCAGLDHEPPEERPPRPTPRHSHDRGVNGHADWMRAVDAQATDATPSGDVDVGM